jgi:hypothetical protein
LSLPHHRREQFHQPPATEGIHLQGDLGGRGAALATDVHTMVDHQHIHLLQHLLQFGFPARLPAHLPQGDGLAQGVAQGEGFFTGGKGNQMGTTLVPAAKQGPAEGTIGSGDGDHRLVRVGGMRMR